MERQDHLKTALVAAASALGSGKAREFDLVVYGATGFSGKVAVDYFARHMPAGCRWAVAGRSRERLDQVLAGIKGLPSQPSDSLIVDHGRGDEVRKSAGRARVALSYVGPFSRYGESVVAACAESGTHYLDITGETLWVRKMMDRYEVAARKSGAILIPFSGFDSVPSDLGAWKAHQAAMQKHPGRRVTRVVNLLSVAGGFNGGTFATLLDMLALNADDRARLHDPALLIPEGLREKYCFPELTRPVRVREAGLTAPPFFMAIINSRSVYRSQALRGDEPFEYVELMRVPRSASACTSWALVAGSRALDVAGRSSAVRALMRKLGPKSGDGPSQEKQEQGFFRAQFFAYSGEELLARFEMSYAGDPGNRATALLSAESALCLLDRSPGAVDHLLRLPGGFQTPSVALGDLLCHRLAAAGVRFGS